MRRLAIALTLLVLASAVTAYLFYRNFHKPLPTLVGWKAHVTTLAGDGSPRFRDANPPTQAALSDPFGVAVAKDGTVYVADGGESNRIRKITPDGILTTVAGGSEGFADGAGAAASFNTPSAIALDDNGNLFVADTGNNRIRKITPEGQVSTVAGDGTAGYLDGPAAQARFNGPIGLAVGARGEIYVADTYNDRIRTITADGQVSTVAGAGTPGYADGDGGTALFDTPCGIAAASDGSVIVADTGNDRLRRITPEGSVTTVSVNQNLSGPIGLALSHDNFIYVTELDRSGIVQIAPDGSVHDIAGDESIRFNQPTGIALGPLSYRPAELYVGDSGNYLISRDDIIILLREQVAILERSIADKEKIIQLLETRLRRIKKAK